MKPMEHSEKGRGDRKLTVVAALVVVALLACPTASVYAQTDAGAGQVGVTTWLAQVGDFWAGLWTTAWDLLPTSLRAADTTDDGTTDPPPDTSGDGGFDGGGGTGVLDPNGGFGI